jgi:hypothetical protein
LYYSIQKADNVAEGFSFMFCNVLSPQTKKLLFNYVGNLSELFRDGVRESSLMKAAVHHTIIPKSVQGAKFVFVS